MSFMEKLNLNLFKFILIFFLTLSNLAFSETKIISYNAIEVGVTDGDSLRFGKERIRLFGIDAPEIKQITLTNMSDVIREIRSIRLKTIIAVEKKIVVPIIMV